MSEWVVKRTDTFLIYLKKHKHNNELFIELDKKIKRLKIDPISVGGDLAGNLRGHRSTRLVKKFRLIFTIDSINKIVYLEAIDHRKDIY
ncbi:MAG: hypothetical protein AABX29_04100 [Nanoarchaeota archaeon]